MIRIKFNIKDNKESYLNNKWVIFIVVFFIIGVFSFIKNYSSPNYLTFGLKTDTLQMTGLIKDGNYKVLPKGVLKSININEAGESELIELPGIGEAIAKRIVEYRENRGYFKTIEEIKNVSGIGEKTFEKFKEYISIN